MPNRDWKLFINDILDCIKKIISYTDGMGQKHFFEDLKTYDAVLRNLEIIGEAAKNIPDEIRKKYGNIEWKKLPVCVILPSTSISELMKTSFGILSAIKFQSLKRKSRKLLTKK